MTSKEVIAAFCEISSDLVTDETQAEVSHDCFCGKNALSSSINFQFDDSIIHYIRDSIRKNPESFAVFYKNLK